MAARGTYSLKVRLLLGVSLLWCFLSLGLGLRVERTARAALEGSMGRELLGIGALAAAQLAPLAPPDLQPDLDGRSAPPKLRAALLFGVRAAGLRDLVLLNRNGLALCDATGEAIAGTPAPMDLSLARADLARGRGHVFPPRSRDFGLQQQSAVFPLGKGLLLEVDADPRQLRAMDGITGSLYACLGGLLLGAGLSLALAVVVLRRERALKEARLAAEATAAERVQLAGAIAHESRNALGAILGQAQWLARRLGTDTESAESAGKIAQMAGQLEGVMRRLLDTTRPLEPKLERVSADALLGDLKSELARLAPRLQVRLRCPADLSLRVDPDLVAAALSNLGRNAVEAMHGEGALLLCASRRDGFWRLEVHDQGPGVPETERERVFEPYYSRKADGIGLGLSFALKVARAHGGRAFVGPSELGGACFTLEGVAS